ncbi:PP2C family protein-serine/threonine phosphatase [Terriglobus albidus]|uniref:PP2C family protein-serine/threonine phosphatase n=1 Tax=Terriglobus albidus TaxID=1592106 RepID=UPI0021DFD0F9|nr:PP2C family protein-serine/threonine phosphatase [Terriglobus albidus]
MKPANLYSDTPALIAGMLNAVVLAALAAVAYADWIVVTDASLAYLYVLPIALCALVNPLTFTVTLAAICTFLGDVFGPARDSLYWRMVHNTVHLTSFLIVGSLVTLIARQRNRMADVVREQRDAYEQDLLLAAQVQRRVLPKPLSFPEIDITGQMTTARLLGGDYYDFFSISEHLIDIVIADVSGKGIAAALLMPSLAVALRLRARELEGPAQIIADLNEVLLEITSSSTFVTMFYARFNRTTRTLQYTNAGHNPPLFLSAESRELQQLDKAGGPVLGLLSSAEYTETSIGLGEGDVLLLYTDGITEQENPQREEFSVERLADVICRENGASAARIADHIADAVTRFAGSAGQNDDSTILVLKT